MEKHSNQTIIQKTVKSGITFGSTPRGSPSAGPSSMGF